MEMTEMIKKYRNAVSIGLAAVGMVIILFYLYCDSACSYLKGEIFGVDLKYIGIGYMLVVAMAFLFKQMEFARMMLAMGVGAEIYLVAFQFREDVFCPFCLTFGAIVILMFLLNYDKPQASRSKVSRVLYTLGETNIPLLGKRIPLLILVTFGYLFVILTFSGSVTPAYGEERSPLPSYGGGAHELIVFTDYFCPPCQSLESELDPFVEELLSGKGVKVTFVDMPLHKLTPLYAKYFLYTANATGSSYKEILQARKVLFSLAKGNAAKNDRELEVKLREKGVVFKPFDPKPAYLELNRLIGQYKIRATPTCVIKYPGGEIRRYTGRDEIRKGITELRSAIKPG